MGQPERAPIPDEVQDDIGELLIGMLGHDLRNPLAAIATGAQLLARRGLAAEDAKVVARIARSAARMARIIDHVMDCARLNTGTGIPLAPEAADLVDVCTPVIEELQVTHPGRAIEVEYLGDTAGVWDVDRLSQAFSNLIGNALAYGDPEQPVRIAVVQDRDDVVVCVHNMGPPIPADVLPTVFDPFRRARSRQPRDRGLGLGLYITREIVRAHGGTIDVRSTADQGTCFRIRLARSAGRMAG